MWVWVMGLGVMEDGAVFGFAADEGSVFAVESVVEAVDVAFGFPFCHGEVVEKVVAATLGSLTRDFSSVEHILEGANHQRTHLLRSVFAFEDEIATRETTHRSPIDNLVFPLRIIAEEGRHQMFDGVHRSGNHSGLLIGSGHTDVESGYDLAVTLVGTREIDTRLEVGVINCKTCD